MEQLCKLTWMLGPAATVVTRFRQCWTSVTSSSREEHSDCQTLARILLLRNHLLYISPPKEDGMSHAF
jgi:hypothetical protein